MTILGQIGDRVDQLRLDQPAEVWESFWEFRKYDYKFSWVCVISILPIIIEHYLVCFLMCNRIILIFCQYFRHETPSLSQKQWLKWI